jgi:uncharacterized phage protein (TIGR01671 family)
MQRVIKFRAWDTDSNRMVPYEDMLLWDHDVLRSFVMSLRDNYIHMQYTGLHDKNGTPIFEGDVVRLRFHEAPDGESFENGVIEWHKPSAAFKWLSGEPSDGNNYWLSQADDKYREVIGNIYEQPALHRQNILKRDDGEETSD